MITVPLPYWLTGLPASGKSTIVAALKPQLEALGLSVEVLESDAVRRTLTPAPTYSQLERDLLYRALAFMGAKLVSHGVTVIFDATANRRAYRDFARSLIPKFIEVAVECPLELAMQRDYKGTYQRGQRRILYRTGLARSLRIAAESGGADRYHENEEESEACALLARDAFPRLRHTSSAVNVAALGLEAALSLPAEHPQRATLVATFEEASRAVVTDRTISVADDDRSALYLMLVEARKDAKDVAGVQTVARQWASFLEAAAKAAKTAEGRTVFDAHLLTAYLTLGEPALAIPMLEASERDFPDDYNPPARLAVTYKELHRWDEAIAASQRALGKAYGARNLRIYQNLADIQTAKGDAAGARATLQEALQLAESLPTPT